MQTYSVDQKKIFRLHEAYETRIKKLLNAAFETHKKTLPATYLMDLFSYIVRIMENHNVTVFWMGYNDKRYFYTSGYQVGSRILIKYKPHDWPCMVGILVHEIGHFQQSYKKSSRIIQKNYLCPDKYCPLVEKIQAQPEYTEEHRAWQYGERLLKIILQNLEVNNYEKF